MEKMYFQANYKAYIARNVRPHNDRCELWAISINEDSDDLFLGTFENGLFKRSEGYYKLPWDVFRASERLSMLVGLSWKQYLIDYKELRNVEWLRMNKRKGRLPDIERIKTVKKLRKAGIKFRDIARAIDKDLKSVYRWNKYNLSTFRRLPR